MFYSITFAGNDKDGTPLRTCWLASHGRKLSKLEFLAFSIPAAAQLISEPTVPLSLRLFLKNSITVDAEGLLPCLQDRGLPNLNVA
jgi:hypothetical protein